MGDPVLRDFRLGVDSLIFSKPISRASYLIGKFLGNFFVFVCCMSTYVLSLIVMQVVHTSAMIVLPVRVLPYFKHFFFSPSSRISFWPPSILVWRHSRAVPSWFTGS